MIAPPPGICIILIVGLPGRYFVKNGSINLENLLVPPPSLKGTTQVMVLPEKSTLAWALKENANKPANKSIKNLNINPP